MLSQKIMVATSAPVVGQVAYTTAGTYNWTVPAGVTSVSVVCVGGGNGEGNLTTSTGTSHFNNSLYAFGSNATTGGGQQGADGGGNGGSGGNGAGDIFNSIQYNAGGGGGGAGGYSGNGGFGGNGYAYVNRPPGGAENRQGGFGGGVGIFGEGTSGSGGASANPGGNGGAGFGGGGGGGEGASTVYDISGPGYLANGVSGFAGSGGNYGGGNPGVAGAAGRGGGGLGYKNNISVTPGQVIPLKVGSLGAVRIIWPGNLRQFPSTRTADE